MAEPYTNTLLSDPHSYDPPVVTFLLERTAPLPRDEAWRRLTDWPRHGDAVPLTRITVTTPEPTHEGTVFVARSGLGPISFREIGRAHV